MISVAAPLARHTTQTFDGQNRLFRRIDPANGVTAFGYDVNGNLTSVTDPRNLTTTYQ